MDIDRVIEELAKKQQQCKIKFLKPLILLLCIAVFSVGWFIHGLIQNEYSSAVLMSAMIPIIAVSCVWGIYDDSIAKWEYNAFYKNAFIRAIISDIDPTFSYEPQSGIDEEEFRKTGIYTNNEFVAEDQIVGVYKGVKFSLSEAIKIYETRESMELVRLSQRAKSDLSAAFLLSAIALWNAWRLGEYVQAFSGSVLVCEFYKEFKGQTIIADRSSGTKFLGDQELMDDVIFGEEFRVFASDKIEARYLLTPSFMERLGALKLKLAPKIALSAAFMDGKFYLFLNGAKNRFEAALFSPRTTLKDAERIKAEVLQLFGIIDELRLNEGFFGGASESGESANSPSPSGEELQRLRNKGLSSRDR